MLLYIILAIILIQRQFKHHDFKLVHLLKVKNL